MRKTRITRLEERVEELEDLLGFTEDEEREENTAPDGGWGPVNVPDSEREQGDAGFKCSHCGRLIRPGETYYCQAITKEKFHKKDGVTEVTPEKAFQTATWCQNCYSKILGL